MHTVLALGVIEAGIPIPERGSGVLFSPLQTRVMALEIGQSFTIEETLSAQAPDCGSPASKYAPSLSDQVISLSAWARVRGVRIVHRRYARAGGYYYRVWRTELA
jgi:hypothetical protein